MTDLELLRHLASLGVQLRVEGGALKFSAPRGVLTDALKETIRLRRDALRALLDRGEPSDPPLAHAPREGPLPLSFGQERLWFLDQLEPGSAAYVLPAALRLEGPLDLDAIRRALSEVVRRHEVLRTTFPVVEGEPVQAIHPPADVDLPVEDLSALPEQDREAALHARASAEVRRPFDLARGPLVRARLLRMGAQDHVLVTAIHHIVFDGWSQGIFAREIGALYDAFSAGRPSPLPDLTLQYADFAAWQRRVFAGERLDREIAWWREQLAGAPASIDLPADRPRPPSQSLRGAQRSFTLSAALSGALLDLARREGATPFMALLAAFAVLLGRCAGQRDVVLGTPVAGRARPETEPLVGFFVNTLALRATIDPHEPFRALLARVRETCVGAYAHQDLPFERLVQALAPERDPARTPLFQVLFSFQSAPRDTPAMGAARRRAVPVETGTAKFDLTLAMAEGPGHRPGLRADEPPSAPDPAGLGGTFEYAADLFDAATIDRMIARFATLLAGVAARPDQAVGRLLILPEDERRQVVELWNATAFPHPQDRPLHALIEAQVDRTPDAVAVSFEGQAVTYRALDEQASRIARALLRRGVGPDVVVGVLMDRSIEMVAALYGVLEAGGAYLPLDPDLPRDRIAFMIEDARPPVILAHAHLADRLPPGRAEVILAGAGAAPPDEPATRPSRGDPSLASLAYVIYTSGSTGRPKGAMNEHRGIVNRLLWMQRAFDLRADDVVAQKTPVGFDVSVWELFWPLVTGARLVVARPDGHKDPGYLADLFAAEGVTTTHFVPSMLRAFLDEPRAPACRSLRRVIASGEALPPALCDRFFQVLGGVALHNLYGPTEAAVDVTWWACREGAQIVPIGRPIDNVRVYVLGDEREPVPIGVRGEIWIGGVQVGRGYVRRPDLTAERFADDPFAPGGRLYRTGDLARWLPDGTLEYLGRADFQVKIRGLRVEPGEIEAAIRRHPAVRDAVVVLREDAPGDPRLVAYLACADGEAPAAADLRALLRATLPEPMVPAAFVVLPRLPLTASGKVDRRALPAPAAGDDGDRAAPRGPVEEAVAAVFAEVLDAPAIGAHESFFDRGGHSLLATRAVARIRAALGVDLPLRAMFEAPTAAGIAARVEQALGAGQGLASPPLARAPHGARAALSFAQERLWFLDRLDPGDPTYVVPLAVRFSGALDAGALARAIREVVRRHEVLRTTYAVEDGKPVVVIRPDPDFDLPRTVLAGLPEPDRDEAVRRAVAEDARRPFDLAAGPVLRGRLLALAEDDHVLILTVHHIAADGWSLGILGREISALYGAFARGLPSPLPDLPLQYADYAAWQRARLAGDAIAPQLAYWKDRLAGAPPVLDLPFDRPRPRVASHRGAHRAFAFPRALGDAIGRVSREHGATPFMTLLAAYFALLHRTTGQRDVVVGTPIAGRTHAETEALVGLFVNTLAIRAEVAGDAAFSDLLARVREACLGAYAHQDVPFERVVEEIDPERDPGRSPLFQVLFSLQNAPADPVALPGVRRRDAAADTGTSKFDLGLALAIGPRGLGGAVEYATDLFDASTIERMVEHLRVLLEGVAEAPDRRVIDLPLLPEDERRRLLVTWNDTAADHPPVACLHHLVEAQVDRTPDAIAVVFEDHALTYAALDAQANRLAHRLERLGVGPDVLVGVCLDRSIELVVALLAVLKAGGAYVPVDPSYPEDRVRTMLEDARAAVVLTQARLAAGLPRGAAAVVAIDAEDLAQESAARPVSAAGAGHLAYVIYTSGSTGRPKGAMITHDGIVNHMLWMAAAFPLGPRHAVLQKTPISFDASVWEFYAPLVAGARLVMARPEGHRDVAYLIDAVAAHGVTELQLVPTLLEVLVADPGLGRCASLERLYVGGEALSRSLVDRFRSRLPIDVVNLYGPTECTVQAVVRIADPGGAGVMEPIGRPIDNARAYVLDGALAPAPIGVPGELYLAGACVGRGYLGRPDLTAERFVPDPFGGDPGGRMYATGDRCRWTARGEIEFLGRADDQIKIRGHRVEPGEIEAALAEIPGVREAVVVAREDAPGDARLVAYVTGEAPPPADLRAHLAARLPAYMVPAAFVALGALPRTPSGKVDRRALPAPDPAHLRDHGRVPPRGPVEETIASIFADLLRLPPDAVGAHDGFFALGGHSLLATQAMARVAAALGVDLPLLALFEASSPADLGARVEAALRGADHRAPPPILPVPRGEPVPLSFAQERLWFLHQLDPEDASYVAVSGVRFEGPLDTDALGRALREIVRRHEVLRTTYALDGDRPVGVVHPDAAIDLPVVTLAHLPAPEREAALAREAEAEARRPFDLATGPVIRARLFVLGPGDHALLVAMHHVVTDAWSMGVLDREIAILHDAFSNGRPSPLPDLPVQYADFAAWQRRRLSGELLDRQLAYWTARLAGAPRAIDLPLDRPHPRVPSRRGATRPFALGAEATRALRDRSRREGATLFMTLLAAFEVLIHRYAGQDDFVVGTPIAGRTRAETEALLGCFVNTLALRADLSGAPTLGELLGRVRADALGAYAHQDLPFERLVEALDPDRAAGRAPLVEVMFVLQNAPAGAAPLPGLRRRPVLAESGAAKLDLTLALVETADGLAGGVEYATDLFDAATIDRMLGSYRVLLEAIAAGADAPAGELPILAPGEREALLAAAGGAASFPVRACLHTLFEAQADRTPDAIAVTFEGEHLSYRALDERAKRVARALAARGVGPEALVGLLVDRSLDLVVGLLGILHAGAAYLPLDPGHPPDRLAFMIADAGARVVIAEARHAAAISGTGAEIVLLDAATEAFAAVPSSPPATPASLAYVIYTSGSTGRPKGVLVTHANVVRLFSAAQACFAFGPSDVWTLFHAHAFDFSVWEIWGALLHGGRVVVVPYWVSRSPDAFHALLAREGVTVLSQTPSAFRPLVHADAAAGEAQRRALALRYVIFGGEALDVRDLGPWWEAHDDRAPLLVNMYGITETTVHVTCRPLGRADLARPWSSVVGGPLPDLSAHVLDGHLAPAPAGVAGEVYVGGAGLARGYLGRPDLTAERFVPDPFRPGERLYRTGDRARRLASGELEHLGRLDQQVKIRGHRIELGEIEAALEGCPGVREAVAAVREDVPGDRRLVGYVVPADPASPPSAGALRASLAERLPEPMVPAAIVVIAAIPLTTNGKIDRSALPAPGAGAPADHPFVAPRGPIEEAIAAIFADVIHTPRVGAHDGFFALGGHSLLAAQAAARLRAALGVDVPLRAIFEAPTVADLAARVEARLREAGPDETPPITPVPRAGPMDLSFGQERLWVLHQIDPADPSYVVPLALRMEGALDVGALDRALHAIVERHEILRTTYASAGGLPAQIVHEDVDLPLSIEDLRALPPAEREEAARREAAAEALRPFDLAAGPVVRARLLALAEDDHLLLLSLHHIAADAWSIELLGREILALHAAFREGRPSPLPALPVQYADYAAWQRRRFSGAIEDRQLAYWLDRLAGAPRVLDLPADRPRPRVPSHRGGRRAFVIDAPVADALRDLGRRRGATLFMTLLAAFDAWIHRHTGERDLVVGTPIANRARPEIEGLVGFFLETLVLRVALDEDQPFTDLLARVRAACLGAYAHQDMPFERLVRALDPERDLGRSPLFQVMFTMRSALPDAGAPAAAGLRVRGMETETAAAKLDLVLGIGDAGSGALGGSVEYAADLFDAATVDRMIERFQVLLAAVAARPDLPVHALPILPDHEAQQILVAWNDTAPTFSTDACLHHLFEDQVDRTPEATAIVAGADRISYRDLDARANRLAQHLRRRGVGPEVLVGLCAERSVSLIVGVLGILKAGGAYVPVDPAYPQHRIAQILEDARAPLLVTEARVRAALPETTVPRILLDADAAALDAEDGARPDGGAGSRNLAYVLFTSGSTGRPKGVAIEHHAAACLVRWAHGVFLPDELRGVLFSTSICFDLSVFELFVPLAAGGTVILAEDALALAVADGVPARDEITLVNTVPTAMAEILRLGALPPSVTTVCLAGEPLTAALADAVHALPHVERLYNLYGPTEDTTYSTFARVARAGAPHIGRPIAGGVAHVLDAHGEPVPIGVPGEIHLGGEGLARGYHGRPDLTAERFVPSPFGARRGARLYRTGDRGRYLPDGAIEYLGRIGTMVKVRGFRVEPGEIDAVLLGHPALREAVTLARADGNAAAAPARLVAYLVADGDPPAVADLRAFVRARLPEFMVPSAFVILPRLPRTPSGKIDRGALPPPETGDRPGFSVAYAVPGTPVEEELARIWAAVLGLPRVGVHDNFFEIGGDSILGIQIVSRAQQAGIRITPRQIFQHPTVAALAAAAGTAATVVADQGPVTGPVVATPIQRWWLEQHLAEPAHYNQSFFFELDDRLDAALLEEVVLLLIDHHDALRMRVARITRTLFQAPPARDPGKTPLWRIDLEGVPEREIAPTLEQVAADAQASLDLWDGPIVRVVLFDLGPDAPSRLLLIVHHLAVDAVSWRILLDDLFRAYDARRRGLPIELPPKTTSFQRWADKIAAHARSEAVLAEAGHWLSDAFAGAPPLPVDHEIGEPTEATARHVVAALSEDETDALLRRVPEAFHTQITQVLLAAFARALGRLEGSGTAFLAMEAHGREDLFEDVDLTRTVGWFTALYPVVLDLGADAGPVEALRTVKDRLRAIPAHGIGYGLLRYLGPPEIARALAALPRPEVVFNYLGQLDPTAREASPLRPARESGGPRHSPEARLPYLLELGASVIGGRLYAQITYSEARHRRSTADALAADFLDALRALVSHALAPDAGGATPSYFPKASLTQDALDMLAMLDPDADPDGS